MLCYLAIALMIFKKFVPTSLSLQTILHTIGQRPFVNGSRNLLTNKREEGVEEKIESVKWRIIKYHFIHKFLSYMLKTNNNWCWERDKRTTLQQMNKDRWTKQYINIYTETNDCRGIMPHSLLEIQDKDQKRNKHPTTLLFKSTVCFSRLDTKSNQI